MDPKSMAARVAAVALSVAAAACGGGGDGSSSGAICQVLAGTLASTTPPPSTLDPAGAAFDADLGTYATLSPTASATTTVRASGISRMAGEIAGIAYTSPVSGNISATITTYRDGAEADSGEPLTQTHAATGGSQVCPGGYCVDHEGGMAYVGLNTTEDFDEIEVVISISNFSAPLELREICVR